MSCYYCAVINIIILKLFSKSYIFGLFINIFRVLCSVDDTFFIGLKEVHCQPLLFLVQKEGQDVRL